MSPDHQPTNQPTNHHTIAYAPVSEANDVPNHAVGCDAARVGEAALKPLTGVVELLREEAPVVVKTASKQAVTVCACAMHMSRAHREEGGGRTHTDACTHARTHTQDGGQTHRMTGLNASNASRILCSLSSSVYSFGFCFRNLSKPAAHTQDSQAKDCAHF